MKRSLTIVKQFYEDLIDAKFVIQKQQQQLQVLFSEIRHNFSILKNLLFSTLNFNSHLTLTLIFVSTALPLQNHTFVVAELPPPTLMKDASSPLLQDRVNIKTFILCNCC